VSTVRYRVIVSGRVQGVWFRESCRQQADAHGVSGWVRNRNDGRVEAVFEGAESDVAQVVAWCRVGPRAAVVTAVDVTEEPPDPAARSGFHVH